MAGSYRQRAKVHRGGRDFLHVSVYGIGHVDIAVRIHRSPRRGGEGVGTAAHHIKGGVGVGVIGVIGKGTIGRHHLQHRLAAPFGNVDIVRPVYGYPTWLEGGPGSGADGSGVAHQNHVGVGVNRAA